MTDNNKSTADRSKKKSENYLIYQYLCEKDLQKLTDEEFLILQDKFKLPSTTGGTYEYLLFTDNGFRAKGLQGDKTLLQVYRRAIAAHWRYFDCFQKYSDIFKLCRYLNAVNIYDIGCGDSLQALLLIRNQEMSYTGIDPRIFHDDFDGFKADTAEINELFYEFTGSDRIYYVNKAYPYDFTVEANNIAIMLNSVTQKSEEKIEELAGHLTHDFERIVITLPFKEFVWKGKNIKEIVYKNVKLWENPYDKYLKLYEKAMPKYKFYKIGEPNIVFATRIENDINILKSKYTVADDKILRGIVDWSDSVIL